MAHVKAGRLRVLGHSLTYDSPMVAGIPKISDTIPGFNYSGWLGLLAPKGTAKPILAKLRTVALDVLNSADTKKRYENAGALTGTSTPDEFRTFVAKETVETGKVARAAGLKPE
jgi:tripartite-type tricarboxylate transporter receptor subunit TctC